jgi:hypothetical protein
MVICMRKFICNHPQVLKLLQDMSIIFDVLYMVLNRLLMPSLSVLSL